MPVCLFTYHAYGSWMPDRRQGFVKRGRGILPRDEHMHRLYAEAMTEQAVEFAESHQRRLIECLLDSETKQTFETHFIATDSTHLHVLLAWRDQRDPAALRGLIKGSMSRSMNAAFSRRTWFSEGGSRKQVRNRKHFDYLMNVYLVKHTGWKWNRVRGVFR